MVNQIRHVKSLGNINLENSYIVKLDGAVIKNKEDYLNAIEKGFHFPGKCEGIWERYLDWITDLDWIPEQKIFLIIYNFQGFFFEDIKSKALVLQRLEDTILPFWEEEVKHVVVGGTPKEFQVYLVD